MPQKLGLHIKNFTGQPLNGGQLRWRQNQQTQKLDIKTQHYSLAHLTGCRTEVSVYSWYNKKNTSQEIILIKTCYSKKFSYTSFYDELSCRHCQEVMFSHSKKFHVLLTLFYYETPRCLFQRHF